MQCNAPQEGPFGQVFLKTERQIEMLHIFGLFKIVAEDAFYEIVVTMLFAFIWITIVMQLTMCKVRCLQPFGFGKRAWFSKCV